MNIYVSHSRNFDYHKELYIPIETSSLTIGHSFIFPHKTSNDLFKTKELFLSKKCDLVLAEVSYPSTGQGIELGWADALDIPIVGIYRHGINISGSLIVVTDQIIVYTDSQDMLTKIGDFLKNEHT